MQSRDPSVNPDFVGRLATLNLSPTRFMFCSLRKKSPAYAYAVCGATWPLFDLIFEHNAFIGVRTCRGADPPDYESYMHLRERPPPPPRSPNTQGVRTCSGRGRGWGRGPTSNQHRYSGTSRKRGGENPSQPENKVVHPASKFAMICYTTHRIHTNIKA